MSRYRLRDLAALLRTPIGGRAVRYAGLSRVNRRWNGHDVPRLLRTSLGRRVVLIGLLARAWPLLAGAARLHRRTLARSTRIVAVTGSYGKTTTTRAITLALGRRPHPWLAGNGFSYLALALLRIRPGDRHAAIEVGISGPRQMAGYARLVRPDVVVVTSIGCEHSGTLGSLEATRQEKADLLRSLLPSGLAVLNGDDPNVLWMASQTSARVITVGSSPRCNVRADQIQLDWPRGTSFILRTVDSARQVETQLLGRHQLHAVLAAVAVAQAEGIPLDRALTSLSALSPTPGRLETISLPNGGLLLRDDFKSGVETIDAALDLLAEIPAERKFVVLGEVDEPPRPQGATYRRLGERLAATAGRVILVGGKYRRYGAGARQAGRSTADWTDAGGSSARAAEILAAELRAGAVALIKGRRNQRLERITLALQGRRVRCDIATCRVPIAIRCATCPMLERGWSSPGDLAW